MDFYFCLQIYSFFKTRKCGIGRVREQSIQGRKRKGDRRTQISRKDGRTEEGEEEGGRQGGEREGRRDRGERGERWERGEGQHGLVEGWMELHGRRIGAYYPTSFTHDLKLMHSLRQIILSFKITKSPGCILNDHNSQDDARKQKCILARTE